MNKQDKEVQRLYNHMVSNIVLKLADPKAYAIKVIKSQLFF